MLNKCSTFLIFTLVSFISVNNFTAASNNDWDPNAYDEWDPAMYDFVYDLENSNFDGEGNYDILAIAQDPGSPSGILSWDDTGHLTVLHLWDSNHLGITWHSQTYTPHIGDFNGDGLADVFMDHKSDGDNYVLLANANGKLELQLQTIGNTYLDLDWGSSNLVFGDFNGDSRTDVYLQPEGAQTPSYVLFANATGTFTTIDDTWDNEHLGFRWSKNDTGVSVADYDNSGQADIRILNTDVPDEKSDYVMIPYKKYKIPVPIKNSDEQAAITIEVAFVSASSTGKFSEGEVLITSIPGLTRTGGHCARVPQLCNSK